jgi:3-phenylpropionate/trans-cinnamate dioxygenase ferredoxin subunit
MTANGWVAACAADDILPEDVVRFDHGGRTFAIYCSPEDEYFATDGLCTHEQVHLADGYVMDQIVECPKYNGRFNYKRPARLKAHRSASTSRSIRSRWIPGSSTSI